MKISSEFSWIALLLLRQYSYAFTLNSSIHSQLKDMAQKSDTCKADGYAVSDAPSTSHKVGSPLNENKICSPTDPQPLESNCRHSHTSCNGTRATTEDAEWVEQVEPGVYITVSSFPGGEKYLKRVRFSRKRFSEQQAEKWWAENRLRLQEKYSVLASEKIQ